MGAATGYLLKLADSGWQLTRLPSKAVAEAVEKPEFEDDANAGGWTGDAAVDADGITSALAQSVRYRGEVVVVSVPSTWCYAASVGTAGLRDRKRSDALKYVLEEKLPISAEDFEADFAAHGETALGVAIETRRIAELLEALDGQEHRRRTRRSRSVPRTARTRRSR